MCALDELKELGSAAGRGCIGFGFGGFLEVGFFEEVEEEVGLGVELGEALLFLEVSDLGHLFEGLGFEGGELV